MKNLSSIFIFVIALFQVNPTTACTCDVDWSFCESVGDTTTILKVQIISKYGDPSLEHLDIKILETIQNGTSMDSLTITTNGLACHFPLADFNVGDTLILAFTQLTSPVGSENHAAIEFSLCRRNFLNLNQNEVSGFISPTLALQNYADFKNNLTACNDLIASNKELEELENAIQISPNPFSENINIDFGNLTTSKISLEIFSAQGQIIASENNLNQSNFQFSTANLSAGIYFVKIIFRDNFIVKKIVK